MGGCRSVVSSATPASSADGLVALVEVVKPVVAASLEKTIESADYVLAE